MTTYNINATKTGNTTTFKLSFGEPAQNDVIVRDAVAALEALGELGGQTALLNGPASLPVAIAIAHKLAHLFTEIAAYDPKLGAYVVSVSHGGRPVGTLIPA